MYVGLALNCVDPILLKPFLFAVGFAYFLINLETNLILCSNICLMEWERGHSCMLVIPFLAINLVIPFLVIEHVGDHIDEGIGDYQYIVMGRGA